jgi:hypothetical protein
MRARCEYLLRSFDERHSPQHVGPVAAMPAGRSFGADQTVFLVEAQGRGVHADTGGDLADRESLDFNHG